MKPPKALKIDPIMVVNSSALSARSGPAGRDLEANGSAIPSIIVAPRCSASVPMIYCKTVIPS